MSWTTATGNRQDAGVWYCVVNGTPHIAYVHPQARMPSSLVHYGLVDAVAELAEIL